MIPYYMLSSIIANENMGLERFFMRSMELTKCSPVGSCTQLEFKAAETETAFHS